MTFVSLADKLDNTRLDIHSMHVCSDSETKGKEKRWVRDERKGKTLGAGSGQDRYKKQSAQESKSSSFAR